MDGWMDEGWMDGWMGEVGRYIVLVQYMQLLAVYEYHERDVGSWMVRRLAGWWGDFFFVDEWGLEGCKLPFSSSLPPLIVIEHSVRGMHITTNEEIKINF